MPNRNVDLTDHHAQFVEELVISGRFADASEVMRAGLSLLEKQALEETETLAALRSLAAEGFDALDQGRGTQLDGPAEVAGRIGQIGRQAALEARQRTAGG